ncbi:hypothetical protein LCGC14_2224290 [marine sediment metagenome]|uniref:Uncharacterized protein n=1 Tax=marine sediment metagenome TaxID=412755 RepID=A0A0F9DXJ6_9ZZZZ
MATSNGNIFRQAKQLLRDKSPLELNREELEVVKIATMPLLLLRMFNDKPIDDELKELAKIVEEAKEK